MAAASLPELVWTDHSTPPTSSTENESNEAFFALAPQPAQNRKLRKLAHPPPSFHAFAAVNQSDLSFIADEPPLPEQSNFPFIFPGRRSVSVDYERTFRSQSESGHSYAYTRSLESSSSRPATFLSMADSQTPLLRSLSSFGARKSMSNLVPTRKLTKRKPSVSSSQFKPLPALEPEPKSLPMLPPAPPLKLLESIENAPKRRGTISFAFTVALKRRLSMPKNKPNQTQVKVPESEPKAPHKTRSSPHVRPSGDSPPLLPKSSANDKGKSVEKSLPSPPPPPPPGKEKNGSLPYLHGPSTASSSSSSKLKKERKDKKKKFSIGIDDDELSVPAPLIQTHLPSDSPPQSSSPVEMVYDLNLERESPVSHHELPSPLRLRPQLVRRNEWQWEAGGRFSVNNYSNMASTQRRWTLAMAMTSDELTDEVFVEEVERIRQNSLRPFDELEQNRNRSIEGAGGFRGWEFGYLDPDSEDDSDEDEGYDDTETYEGEFPGRERSMPDLGRPMSDEGTNETLPRRSTSVMQMISTASSHPNSGLNPDPTKAWSSALHALLITRDLLRTERNYLDQLKLLLSSSPCEMTPAAQAFAETSFLWGAPESSMSSSGAASTSGLLNLVTTDSLKSNSGTIPWPDYPSPSLMHAYLLSLVALSLSLLTEWEKDPTVVSMGQIFVAKEEEIERVFVGWCGAVAGWMVGQKTKRGKKYKSTGGAVGEKRSRKLSKSKFSTPTSSISHLNLSTLTPSATSPPVSATASSLSTPPISFISTANTEAGGRPVVHSSNTGVATAKWRKSMSNIPDLRFDPQRSDSCTDVTSVTVEFPKSIGSKPGCFADSQSSSLSMPSTEVTRVRRASTMLSMNMNLPDVRKDQEGRGRRDLSYTELPRSRSQGVLPVMISAKSRFSKLSYAQTGAGFNREPSFGLIDGNGRKIHSVRELGILPVQRVTRYALLFRDLLKCTPQTSPSRAILEQASDAAIRIAAKCDRAQGNAKFFFSNSVVGSDKTPN